MWSQPVDATHCYRGGTLKDIAAEDLLDPGLIRVSEVWESREHLTAHLQTPHMAQWQRERAELGLTGRDITVFEADGGTAL